MDDDQTTPRFPRRWASRVASRRTPPRAWEDDHAPWHEDAFSERFARTASLGPGRARREAEVLAGLVPPGGRTLDLGCGAGRTAVALARHGVEVLGVDVGEGALRLARAAAGDLPCRFRVGDVLEDPFPEGPFDMAYAVDGTLAGFPEERFGRALEQVRGALHPGGHLAFELPSQAMAEALDLRQDWYLDHESLAGRFPQLVLTEDFYLREEPAYVHRIFCLDLRDDALHGFTQTYALYTEAAVAARLEGAGFRVLRTHGDWGPDAYAEGESQRLIVVAERI